MPERELDLGHLFQRVDRFAERVRYGFRFHYSPNRLLKKHESDKVYDFDETLPLLARALLVFSASNLRLLRHSTA